MAKDGEQVTVQSPAGARVAARGRLLPAWRPFGLSAKLLLLTILFVMAAEVLIFVPSVANFRVAWLNDRLMAARLAALATEGRPDDRVTDSMRLALLSLAQVKAVAIKRADQKRQVLPPDAPLTIDASFDLRTPTSAGPFRWLGHRLALIHDALDVYVAAPDRTIVVRGKPELAMGTAGDDIEFVEIVIPEQALRSQMVAYSINILVLSIVISVIAAGMLYAVLTRLLVGPILRIASTMVAFSENPADDRRIIVPSGRSDEIGTAERQLERMQRDLTSTLHNQKRLADLGLAVAKIAHDLRNMLSSAQLISDRLAMLKDPAVQRFAPKLMSSLDRAIAFCNDTVRFGRADETPTHRERFVLVDLIDEVGDGLLLPRAGLDWRCEVEPGLEIDADRQQLYRLLNNLVRNAVGALEKAAPATAPALVLATDVAPGPASIVPEAVPHGITISATRAGTAVAIRVADTGPGLTEKAKANLFKAFQGGATAGGSGLGLAIAAEITAAHGGSIRLLETERGATFECLIPDRS